MERERCEGCGRFKLYNTGGGLICTNINCREGVTIDQDYKEVDTIREKNLSNQNNSSVIPPVIKSVCEHKDGSRIVFGERRCAKCGALFGRI